MEPLLAADLDIVNLEQWFKKQYTKIRQKYKFVKRALKKIRKQYEDLCRQLTNAKKSLKDEIKDAFRKDYFFCIYNEMMKK